MLNVHQAALVHNPRSSQYVAAGELGASPNSFQGSSLGTQVTLGPGRFSVTEELSQGGANPPGLVPAPVFNNNCNGTITTAGQQLGDCIITNRFLADGDGDGIPIPGRQMALI